jgi:excisionase family DNA binding protein
MPPGKATEGPVTQRHLGNRDAALTSERLLTIEATAERLSTSPRFVRRLIAERRIECVKVGRHVRISESALADFIKAGKVSPLPADLRHMMRGVGRSC